MTWTKKLGVVVAVDGSVATVGVYEMLNDAQLIWNGEMLSGPKIGALLTINQNDVKIIAAVITEKVIDQQNSIKSIEFDNRYSKNSINRVIQLKIRGVIKNNKFMVTSSFVPMIGNEVTLTTQDELGIIYNVKNPENSIVLGRSIFENQVIEIDVNSFFASHIGIFGNTGSGKSNTVHKLFLTLFNSRFQKKIFEKSKFFIIDFNGEYSGEKTFDVETQYKRVFNINTSGKPTDKIYVDKKYLFDADILSILFDARPATQVPFLRNALRTYSKQVANEKEFADLELGLLISILKGIKQVAPDAKDNWIQAAKNIGISDNIFYRLEHIQPNTYQSEWMTQDSLANLKANGVISQQFCKSAGLDKIEEELEKKFQVANDIKKLEYFLEFQKVFVSAWKSTNIEFINPLFHRIKSAFESLNKVVEVRDHTQTCYRPINVFNLLNANREITRLLPMLLSKMFYDQQKESVADAEVTETKHLIIDEAHNILNSDHKNVGDDWQDYRMSVFEEIIKEGRKFGFYLTISSQRPADISPTILSQVHNYLIHRLVNEQDLRILENTMPTLDRSSFQMIPSLGKGEIVLTGTSILIPVFLKIEKEKIRPKSDDVILTKIWK